MKVKANPAREYLLKMGPDPDTWPRWPCLPVKKYQGAERAGLSKLGYVLDPGGETNLHIREGNPFAPKETDPIIATYDSWLAMADDGWVID